MSTQLKRPAIISAFVTLIFVGGFFLALLWQSGKVDGLNNALNTEKLNSEKQLSEKMETEKQVLKANSDLASLKTEYESTSKQLDEADKKLEAQKKIVANAKSNRAHLIALKKVVTGLKQKKESLETQINDLVAENKSLKSKETELNSSVALLTDENQKLKENNALMSSMIANNTLLETFKGRRDKLTVIARKTKKVQAEFDLPVNMTESLSFKVTAPDGKTYQNGEKNVITYSVVDVPSSNLVASIDNKGGVPDNIKRVKLIFTPQRKLTKGIYTISIMNRGDEVGKMQVPLR